MAHYGNGAQGNDAHPETPKAHLPIRFRDALASRVSRASASPLAIFSTTRRASAPPTASSASSSQMA